MTHTTFRPTRFLPVTLLAIATLAVAGSSIGHSRAIQPDSRGVSGSSLSVSQEQAVCEFAVDVSPYQINIDSGGTSHYVRVLTYTWYGNTAEVFVYINPPDNGGDPIDPIDADYVKMTRDSWGHLVVKIDLIAFQEAALEPDTFHDLKIVAVLKQPDGDCTEKEGTGQFYIIDQNGP